MKILIVDIETTGFLGQGGKIVELGIVELCLNSGEKKIVFDQVINPGQSDEVIQNSWIVKNGYMDLDTIKKGVLFENIKYHLQEKINEYTDGATAYNRSFDFDFLESYGIKFPKKLPCPMLKSTNICKLAKKGWSAQHSGYKWPKVEEAYSYFYPKSEYIELHRGADDAFHEADIVYKLHKLGKFL